MTLVKSPKHFCLSRGLGDVYKRQALLSTHMQKIRQLRKCRRNVLETWPASFSHLLDYTGLPAVLKFLKFNRCPKIVLKSAVVLKFYSFGHDVLICTFVMLSLQHCIHFVLYFVNRTLISTFGLLTYLLHFCLSMFITVL